MSDYCLESSILSCELILASSALCEGVESRVSRPALATSLAPPSLVEGMTPSAIQRRTVLRDMPVTRTMSPARRYSVPAVMTASPTVDEMTLPAAHTIRGRLAEQASRPSGLRRD